MVNMRLVLNGVTSTHCQTSNFFVGLWVMSLRGTPTLRILVLIRSAWVSPHGSEINAYTVPLYFHNFHMYIFSFFAMFAAQTL